MEEMDTFFDEEEEIKDFHEYIESQISYDKPGNLLYSAKMIFGREYATDGSFEMKSNRWFFEQFTEDGWNLKNVTYDLHNSEFAKDNIMTEYEKNFSEKGFSICSAWVKFN